jgi:DNA-binding NarL/FixJ family response regulator
MRVLIVDDHSLFRDGISSLLEAAGFNIVGQAGDGQAAITQVEKLQPDLVLLDIHMPVMNGLEALKRIKAGWPGTRVVMLTVSEDENDLVAAIQSGAEGFLLKHLSAPEFIEMLEGIKRGEAAISRKATTFLIKRMAQPTVKEPEGEPLTEREIEILRLLAGGLSNKQISERLMLSENTVKYHLKNLLRKLAVQNRTEAVMKALQEKIIES